MVPRWLRIVLTWAATTAGIAATLFFTTNSVASGLSSYFPPLNFPNPVGNPLWAVLYGFTFGFWGNIPATIIIWGGRD